MSEPEDLMVNPFFQTLKTKFSTLYQQIETNCWFLCVPRARSCQGLKYSKEIFGMNKFYYFLDVIVNVIEFDEFY